MYMVEKTCHIKETLIKKYQSLLSHFPNLALLYRRNY